AVAVELHDHLALLAADIDVGVDQLPAGVVVVGIVGRELVVPDDLAGRRPQGQHRRGVEIVAVAALRRPRCRIAYAPIHQIELGVVGARDPGRAAADLPGIIVLRPAVGTLFTAGWDG